MRNHGAIWGHPVVKFSITCLFHRWALARPPAARRDTVNMLPFSPARDCHPSMSVQKIPHENCAKDAKVLLFWYIRHHQQRFRYSEGFPLSAQTNPHGQLLVAGILYINLLS